MAMVINTNEQSTRIHSMYNKNIGQMNAAMTRIATAQKINSAKDGAANWAISEKMRERIRANDQANQNIQNDTALLKTAQDGLGNTLDILQTLKERAINAANDANISTDRVKISEEVKQLVAQIDDNAAKVKFNGRQLLNGATEANATSGTTSATAVTAEGNYGDKAVYGITGLYTAKDTPITADGSTLVSLVGSNGDTLFQVGDKIEFNWTENGVSKSSSLTVASSTIISDMKAFGTGSYVAASNNTGAKDESGNNVTAPVNGYYFVGPANYNISNFSISVTNKEGVTNTAAQNAVQPVAVQQSYGDDTKGSNEVYYTSVITGGDDDTKFYKLTGLDTTADTGDLSDTTYTLNINGKEITFTGELTVNEINAKMKENGINAEFHVAAAKSTLTYDGETVTKGTQGASVDYTTTILGTTPPATTAATATGLYLVGAKDENITSISLKADSTHNTSKLKTAFTLDTTAGTNNATKAFERVLSLDETSSTSTSSLNGLPQGDALQFYVGGESNFGINFSIGKATVENLFGTSASNFASMFKDKDSAEKAINVIEDAINKTLVEQTRLGAMEARLGYTSENISSMNTNLESGVSAYRDADLAKEMTNYMKYSVMAQSSQYMLAQATQNPFSVLQLLQP